MTDYQKGIASGLFCFIFWGIAPIYFKWLQHVDALEIIAHRIIWGVLFLAVFLLIREHKNIWASLKITYKQLFMLLLSGLMVASNWLMFVWAVTHDQILATSLGYFINPLVNIVLGVLFLKEQLTQRQTLAVIIAALATVYLGIFIGQPPWISLFLAFSFGLYGILRKQLNVRPLIGLFWETLILLIPAIVYLLFISPVFFSHSETVNIDHQFTAVLLFFSGLVTILPLIGFNYAAKKLPLSILGFLQYIAPTMSFLIAVIFYKEVFTFGHKVAFLGIWSALLIISWSPLKKLIKQK